jgi:hypothetical protein
MIIKISFNNNNGFDMKSVSLDLIKCRSTIGGGHISFPGDSRAVYPYTYTEIEKNKNKTYIA